MLGLYLHVPFCKVKCPYCDFYSTAAFDDTLLDRYAETLCAAMDRTENAYGAADTLYFGGGTPSLLGGKRLTRLIEHAAARFGLQGAEITLEANPADDLADTLAAFAAAGGNRLSLGMQAANDTELGALGRRHRMQDLYRTAEDAARAGIANLSLDLMLATPKQTDRSVSKAVEVCRELGARHVSAYLLKVEPHTPFFAQRDTLALPDDDTAADRYLFACEQLERAGFSQYEISNFACEGYESRHNLKYWSGDDYLGLGPAAHSFLSGVRWEYPRDLAAFLRGEPPVAEQNATAVQDASPTEYAMLRLRLVAGLREQDYRARFGAAIPPAWRNAAAALPPQLVTCDEDGIRLTREGFLLENPLVARILQEGGSYV
ncbi:MAG: radical SAM family heme chaperone HemW [Ruminococcaceae bacterium]|nr:radical SAM family heme chaperone HemW [Oscillospiraceae bacterium]